MLEKFVAVGGKRPGLISNIRKVKALYTAKATFHVGIDLKTKAGTCSLFKPNHVQFRFIPSKQMCAAQ